MPHTAMLVRLQRSTRVAGTGAWRPRPTTTRILSEARASVGAQPDGHLSVVSEDKGHSWTEFRTAAVVSSKSLAEHHEFPGLKASGPVEAAREAADGTKLETQHFAQS